MKPTKWKSKYDELLAELAKTKQSLEIKTKYAQEHRETFSCIMCSSKFTTGHILKEHPKSDHSLI